MTAYLHPATAALLARRVSATAVCPLVKKLILKMPLKAVPTGPISDVVLPAAHGATRATQQCWKRVFVDRQIDVVISATGQ